MESYRGKEWLLWQWTIANLDLTLCDPMDHSREAPLSVGSPMQEYWTGLSFPPPRHLPDPGNRTNIFYISCTGKQILYHWVTWKPWDSGQRLEGVKSGEYSIAEKHWVQKSKRFGIRTFLPALRLRLRSLCFKMREGDACPYLAALVWHDLGSSLDWHLCLDNLMSLTNRISVTQTCLANRPAAPLNFIHWEAV